MIHYALAAATTLTLVSGNVFGNPVSEERKQELSHMLKHDCGSCHGLKLTGGLGPPLSPGNLEGFSNEFLRLTILYGRPGTPMPPFKDLLTEQEVNWMIDDLRRGGL